LMEILIVVQTILAVATLVLIALVETKLELALEYVYRTYNRVWLMASTLEHVEKKLDELSEKIVG